MEAIKEEHARVPYKDEWGRDIPEGEINVLPLDPGEIFTHIFDALEYMGNDETYPFTTLIAVLVRDAERELKQIIDIVERDVGKIELVFDSRLNKLCCNDDPVAARLTAID